MCLTVREWVGAYVNVCFPAMYFIQADMKYYELRNRFENSIYAFMCASSVCCVCSTPFFCVHVCAGALLKFIFQNAININNSSLADALYIDENIKKASGSVIVSKGTR